MFPISFSSPYSRNIFIRLTCKNHIEYSIVFFANFFVFLGHRSSVTDDSLICFCLDHQEINWNWLSRSFRVLCWARNGIKFSWKLCQFTSIFRNLPLKSAKKSIFNKVIRYSRFWHKNIKIFDKKYTQTLAAGPDFLCSIEKSRKKLTVWELESLTGVPKKAILPVTGS